MTRFDFDGAPNRIVGDGLMIVALAVVAGALLWMMIGCTPRHRPDPPCPSDSAAGRRTCRQMHPLDIQDDWIDRDCDPEEER